MSVLFRLCVLLALPLCLVGTDFCDLRRVLAFSRTDPDPIGDDPKWTIDHCPQSFHVPVDCFLVESSSSRKLNLCTCHRLMRPKARLRPFPTIEVRLMDQFECNQKFTWCKKSALLWTRPCKPFPSICSAKPIHIRRRSRSRSFCS